MAVSSSWPGLTSPRYRRMARFDSTSPAPNTMHARPPNSSIVSRSPASPSRIDAIVVMAALSWFRWSAVRGEELRDERFDQRHGIVHGGRHGAAEPDEAFLRPEGGRLASDHDHRIELAAERAGQAEHADGVHGVSVEIAGVAGRPEIRRIGLDHEQGAR